MNEKLMKIAAGAQIVKDYAPTPLMKALAIPMVAGATTATIGGIINNLFLNSRIRNSTMEGQLGMMQQGAYSSPEEQTTMQPQPVIIVQRPPLGK